MYLLSTYPKMTYFTVSWSLSTMSLAVRRSRSCVFRSTLDIVSSAMENCYTVNIAGLIRLLLSRGGSYTISK